MNCDDLSSHVLFVKHAITAENCSSWRLMISILRFLRLGLPIHGKSAYVYVLILYSPTRLLSFYVSV